MQSYYFFSEKYLFFFPVLSRYFNYVFKADLILMNEASIEYGENIIVFFFDEEKDRLDIVYVLHSFSGIQFISLGFDESAMINLIDLINIKNRTPKCVESPQNFSAFFRREDIIQKIRQFYHTHGEGSLLEGLNNTIYYLQNGIFLYKSNDLEWKDSRDKFLKLGIEWWRKFIERFKRYKHYFSLLDFKNEMYKIETCLKQFSEFIAQLEPLDASLVSNIGKEKIQRNMDTIHRIDTVLTGIADQLGITIQ